MAGNPSDPIIVSDNRYADIAPYIHSLFKRDPHLWGGILIGDFPPSLNRAEEEEFLRHYFDEREIAVQGGPGEGYKFLKQVWWCMAIFNQEQRLPYIAERWLTSETGQTYLKDAEMAKWALNDRAGPQSFFPPEDVEMFGEKFLVAVVNNIKRHLHELHFQPSKVVSGTTTPQQRLASEQSAVTSQSITPPEHAQQSSSTAPHHTYLQVPHTIKSNGSTEIHQKPVAQMPDVPTIHERDSSHTPQEAHLHQLPGQGIELQGPDTGYPIPASAPVTKTTFTEPGIRHISADNHHATAMHIAPSEASFRSPHMEHPITFGKPVHAEAFGRHLSGEHPPFEYQPHIPAMSTQHGDTSNDFTLIGRGEYTPRRGQDNNYRGKHRGNPHSKNAPFNHHIQHIGAFGNQQNFNDGHALPPHLLPGRIHSRPTTDANGQPLVYHAPHPSMPMPPGMSPNMASGAWQAQFEDAVYGYGMTPHAAHPEPQRGMLHSVPSNSFPHHRILSNEYAVATPLVMPKRGGPRDNHPVRGGRGRGYNNGGRYPSGRDRSRSQDWHGMHGFDRSTSDQSHLLPQFMGPHQVRAVTTEYWRQPSQHGPSVVYAPTNSGPHLFGPHPVASLPPQQPSVQGRGSLVPDGLMPPPPEQGLMQRTPSQHSNAATGSPVRGLRESKQSNEANESKESKEPRSTPAIGKFHISAESTHVLQLIIFDVPLNVDEAAVKGFFNERVGGAIKASTGVPYGKYPLHFHRHTLPPKPQRFWVTFDNHLPVLRMLNMCRDGSVSAWNGQQVRIEVPERYWDPAHPSYPGLGHPSDYGHSRSRGPVHVPELMMRNISYLDREARPNELPPIKAATPRSRAESATVTPTPSVSGTPKKGKPKKNKNRKPLGSDRDTGSSSAGDQHKNNNNNKVAENVPKAAAIKQTPKKKPIIQAKADTQTTGAAPNNLDAKTMPTQTKFDPKSKQESHSPSDSQTKQDAATKPDCHLTVEAQTKQDLAAAPDDQPKVRLSPDLRAQTDVGLPSHAENTALSDELVKTKVAALPVADGEQLKSEKMKCKLQEPSLPPEKSDKGEQSEEQKFLPKFEDSPSTETNLQRIDSAPSMSNAEQSKQNESEPSTSSDPIVSTQSNETKTSDFEMTSPRSRAVESEAGETKHNAFRIEEKTAKKEATSTSELAMTTGLTALDEDLSKSETAVKDDSFVTASDVPLSNSDKTQIEPASSSSGDKKEVLRIASPVLSNKPGRDYRKVPIPLKPTISIKKQHEKKTSTGVDSNGQREVSDSSTVTPTPTFKTAPSTPALPSTPVLPSARVKDDDMAPLADESVATTENPATPEHAAAPESSAAPSKAQEKKDDKVKGPAKTESLSMFGKKQKPAPKKKDKKSNKQGTLKSKPKELDAGQAGNSAEATTSLDKDPKTAPKSDAGLKKSVKRSRDENVSPATTAPVSGDTKSNIGMPGFDCFGISPQNNTIHPISEIAADQTKLIVEKIASNTTPAIHEAALPPDVLSPSASRDQDAVVDGNAPDCVESVDKPRDEIGLAPSATPTRNNNIKNNQNNKNISKRKQIRLSGSSKNEEKPSQDTSHQRVPSGPFTFSFGELSMRGSEDASSQTSSSLESSTVEEVLTPPANSGTSPEISASGKKVVAALKAMKNDSHIITQPTPRRKAGAKKRASKSKDTTNSTDISVKDNESIKTLSDGNMSDDSPSVRVRVVRHFSFTLQQSSDEDEGDDGHKEVTGEVVEIE